MRKDRGRVWLAVAGIVERNGKWLVVKKNYGGMKGEWSFPAGFVDEGETIDEALCREILEETGIHAQIVSFAGIRTGVINHEISDNLLLFYMRATGGQLMAKQHELMDAAFMTMSELTTDSATSKLVHFFLEKGENEHFHIHQVKADPIFGYTSYKILANQRKID